MKRLLNSMLAVAMVLAVTTSALAGSVEIRLKDGSKWRGQVSDPVEVTYVEQGIEVKFSGELTKARDLYIIVKGDVAGVLREKTIFRDDVVSMRTLGADEPASTTRLRA